MSRNLVIAVVVILIIAAGWFLLRPKQPVVVPAPSVQSQPVSSNSASPSATEGAMMKDKSIVDISSNGYSPQSITIKAGESVTWINKDAANHTVNSDPHPTHTLYAVLNKIGLLKPGESKSVQFPTPGVYKYHDHLNPSLTGTVTVQ